MRMSLGGRHRPGRRSGSDRTGQRRALLRALAQMHGRTPDNPLVAARDKGYCVRWRKCMDARWWPPRHAGVLNGKDCIRPSAGIIMRDRTAVVKMSQKKGGGGARRCCWHYSLTLPLWRRRSCCSRPPPVLQSGTTGRLRPPLCGWHMHSHNGLRHAHTVLLPLKVPLVYRS